MQLHSLPYKTRRRAKSLRKSALLRPGSNIYPDPSTAAGISSGPSPLISDDDTSNRKYPITMRRNPSSSNRDYNDTAFWGWIVLVVTWIVFVIGMGSVLGVWDWAWYGNDGRRREKMVVDGEDEEDELPIDGYYPSLLILTGVMAWVWVVIAWVGMKYFKHAKIKEVENS